MKDTDKDVWYNNADWIVNLILVVIVSIILCSQSYAVGRELSFTLFSSVINHNSIYFFILIYFVLLKFSFGKKYFNYLNIVLMFLYGITTITSFFTVIQAFSLNAVLSFILNFFFLIYLFHTFLRGTRVWKEFKLEHSPFNEITNEMSFYSILVVSVFVLAVDLISTAVFSGVILSALDAFFAILFARYIYLYHYYLDARHIDSVNDGNFDGVKKEVSQFVDNVEDTVQETLEKMDLESKVEDVKDVIKETSEKVFDQIDSISEAHTENESKENEVVEDSEVHNEIEEVVASEETDNKAKKEMKKENSSKKNKTTKKSNSKKKKGEE